MLSHHVKESKCISASIGGHIDHAHLLVGLSRTITIAQLVENVKTDTSKWAKKVQRCRFRMNTDNCAINTRWKSMSDTCGIDVLQQTAGPLALNLLFAIHPARWARWAGLGKLPGLWPEVLSSRQLPTLSNAYS